VVRLAGFAEGLACGSGGIAWLISHRSLCEMLILAFFALTRLIRLVSSIGRLSIVKYNIPLIALTKGLIDSTTSSYLVSRALKFIEKFLSLDIPCLFIRFSLDLPLIELFLIL
jgi:hypothetical protein